jgi:hypothetical protein
MSLPKSIDAVKKIFAADRRNPVDREVAAKHLGYSGKSGASDKALAALAHFGLTEKVGKGEVRVSQLAMDIMHPDPTDPASKDRALLDAGMKPQLYKELRSQFPDHVSDETLESYLLRIGFVDAALSPAKTAYLETLRFLEQLKAFESGGNGGQSEQESDLQDNDAGDEMQDEVIMERPAAPRTVTPTPPITAVSGETEWMRSPLGRDKAVRLLVTGTMQGKDIGKLIKLLEAQKAILDDDDDEEDDPLLQ